MPDARSAPEPKKEPEPEPVVEESEEDKAAKESKAKADELKKKGTELYKKRQFDEAIANYNEAWETHKDITYKTNEGAAKFEKGDYEGCIKACQEAVDYGREVYADFKIVAKAFARIGTAYEKLGDLSNAILFYQKAQTEHRTPEVLAKLRAAEKAKIKADRDSYISPEEAEKARELGNAKFKAADWPAAVDAYSEMIKRAPDDPRGYSNRAACFIKLLEFPSAVQDCDEAIKRDPDFIRAYLRKAQAYFTMREYSKCVDVCGEAALHDKDGKNSREIQQQESKALQAQYSAREDYQHLAGSCYEQYPPTSQGRSRGSSGAFEEPRYSSEGPEVGTRWCHPNGSIKGVQLVSQSKMIRRKLWFQFSLHSVL
ncbi:hypothetical protein BDU57DRAFT_239698 [Ampelomyces quisqualis]|uniref:TPR-like protein n=1 Tax=Ampelomyces quisqualis TaxID=50730 RepID=A0A6A5QM12_AMPQU|nr:hypothetical protein BDU57DRAFT_239698 [Ampelomyces quisqualis]